MQKLARQDWASGIAFSAYGLRVGIRTNLPETPKQLLQALPPDARLLASNAYVDRLYSVRFAENQPEARVKRFHIALSQATLIARSLDLNEVMGQFESQLHAYLAEFSRRDIFIHAGVVGWKGKAILIPGASSTGKSTLTEALVRAGATYYSDEFAVVDERGRVKPFPRAISIREDGGRTVRRIEAVEIGAETGKSALPIAAVWVTRFRPGATWRPRKVSNAKGLLGLLANTVQARTRPQIALKILQKVAMSSIFLESHRGGAEQVVRALRDN